MSRIAALLVALALLVPHVAQALDTDRPDVHAFVEDMVTRQHLDRAWVEKVVAAAELKPAIVEAMSRPAERVLQWAGYRKIFMTEQRIREGREFYATHRALLEDVAGRTGVPGEYVAAIVGVETRYALRRQPKVRARASANAIGSPSPSTSARSTSR